MKKMTSGIAALAATSALVLAGCASSGTTDDSTGDQNSTDDSTTTEEVAAGGAQDLLLWLMGTDTPDALIDYLKTEYNEVNGGTLTVEQIGWGDAISNLTTALPDSANTPDVTEVGNTQAATFTTVGAFMDITDMYEELGGDSLLQGFVEAGSVGEQRLALPYYFGSRMVWYRKDLYEAGGVEVPTTLAEVTEVNASLKEQGVGGFYVPGQDWRDGISWVFANGGEIATFDGNEWSASLASDESIAGMQQWQELFTSASVAQVTDDDSTAYEAINDDFLAGTPAATTMAPNWAYWSLGDVAENDEGEMVATWNDDKFGAYALPGVDGGIAPVFAGGSNIAISAATQNEEGAKTLMRIIFSEEYQTMLAENGLGPANLDYADTYTEIAAMGDIALAAAESAKLTPAAPGWAAIEEAKLMEQYFAAVAEGGDVSSLAVEYDARINELING